MADDPRATLRSLEQQLRDLAAELASDLPSAAGPPERAAGTDSEPVRPEPDAEPAPAAVPPPALAERAGAAEAAVVGPAGPAPGARPRERRAVVVRRGPATPTTGSAGAPERAQDAEMPSGGVAARAPGSSSPADPAAVARPAATAGGRPSEGRRAPGGALRPLAVREQVLALADRVADVAAAGTPAAMPASVPATPSQPTAAVPAPGPPRATEVEVVAEGAGTPEQVLALRDAIAGLGGVTDAYLSRVEGGRVVLEVRLG